MESSEFGNKTSAWRHNPEIVTRSLEGALVPQVWDCFGALWEEESKDRNEHGRADILLRSPGPPEHDVP